MRQDIKYINNKQKAKSIFTYDFTRLYTNIPHDVLREQVKFVLDEAFCIKSDKHFVRLNKHSSTWAEKLPKNGKSIFLDEEASSSWFNYLIDNIYVKYGNRIFRQITGIPMGTDCAPGLANLFLLAYEYKYSNDLIDTGSDNLDKFRYIFSKSNKKNGKMFLWHISRQ